MSITILIPRYLIVSYFLCRSIQENKIALEDNNIDFSNSRNTESFCYVTQSLIHRAQFLVVDSILDEQFVQLRCDKIYVADQLLSVTGLNIDSFCENVTEACLY